MKIAIYGAGAVGCVVGARLHEAGAEVTLIARGGHLTMLKKDGLRLTTEAGENIYPIPATDDPHSVGAQDYIFIASKSYDIPALASGVKPLLYKNSAVVPISNGVPWWYFETPNVPLSGHHLKALDPKHQIIEHIPHARVLGGVCSMGASLIAPGQVKLTGPVRLNIGEPDGGASVRVQRLGGVLQQAGFRDPLCDNIRERIWWKLGWNIAFNTLGVLTGKTCTAMTSDPDVLTRVRTIIAEMNLLASALGLGQTDVEQHIASAAKMGEFKTSMQQDHERGKRMEIEAIVGAVVEIAITAKVEIPTLHTLYGELNNLQ